VFHLQISALSKINLLCWHAQKEKNHNKTQEGESLIWLADWTSSHSNVGSVMQINCSRVRSAGVLPLILEKVWNFWTWLSKIVLHAPNKKHASHPLQVSKVVHMPKFKHILKCLAELLTKGGWTTLLRLPLSCATATAEAERKQRGRETFNPGPPSAASFLAT